MDRRVQQLISARKGLAPAAAAVAAPPVPGIPAPSMKFQIPSSLLGNTVSFLFYASLTIFILFLITTFIHFTIYPIFKLSPSESGLLPISLGQGAASASDWCRKPADANQKANLGNTQPCDFTISLDVYMDRAYSGVTTPRMLLYRGDVPVDISASAKKTDLATLYNISNIYAYIDGVTNDLYVCALTRVNGAIIEECMQKITNIPVNTAFRIVIIYAANFIELYMNGKLQSTLVLKGRPVECTKDFYAPSAKTINIAKVGNLFYWPRLLAAQEASSAGPALSTDFFISRS